MTSTMASIRVRVLKEAMMSPVRVIKRMTATYLTLAAVLFAATDGGAQGDSKERWDKLVEAARKEGKVVIHAGPGNDSLFAAFLKRFPAIKVTYIPGHGGARIERIMSERRADQYLADLYMGGGGPIREVLHRAKVLDPIKRSLILPEVLDLSKWWDGRHVYFDDEGEYILAFNGITQHYFHYNTGLVNAVEWSSYWDLLNPKWKGRILTWEPLAPGTDGVLRFLYHNPAIGPQFLRRFFGEMEITTSRDTRQFIDWLATGRFPIAGLQSADRAELYAAKKQGLPVQWFDARNFREGAPLSTSSGNIALLNRAAHPSAAAVFINWLLSRDGQVAFQKTEDDNDSLRIDIPKENVPAHVRRVDGVKYIFLSDRAYVDFAPVRDLVSEVWRPKK